ncbi:hypothetical protein M409DRAFT_58684 [Zasmidium cellare ATCC 36951]|uniref:7-dehydrocholesterol reductase n=1 Tax=Zasmidium cellare ATCC 36951 TaxID=1080233 RepID=A0A6A6C6L9_ZASCE|nr:uncharacterized protein M409DRAFT_58684 [Zasmidium cellare ATCC 36951]KAF2161908.1 hypothetical protein M409DRAFT_58684 [Zasmidium cellare ATCC 36951]
MATDTAKQVPFVNWGISSTASKRNTIGVLGLIIGCPTLVILNWIALEQYRGSLTGAIRAAFSQGPIRFLVHNLPRPTVVTFAGYVAWLLLQTLLYGVLPGAKAFGQRTPGGNLLSYTTNGLAAWAVTHILFLSASVLGLIDPAMIAKHWEGLLVMVNVYGFFLGFLAQIKAYWFPSHPEDRKFSGSWISDFWAGVELNPRFGEYWDFKFFHNGRPGIVAWSLIGLSWAAYQYQTLGHVTESMLIVLILQTTYVVDFFYNEDWYLRTIDISHDHFGLMLAWGDSTFLPTFYTLQFQYLARYPTYLTPIQAAALVALGFFGYAIFRESNYQRDHVRTNPDSARIWGRKATFITCSYRTADGKVHDTLLLTSGWWGLARHSNYLADLVQTWAWCATCGFKNILPWSYFIYMCILLYHRSQRDERRCRNKYGEKWEEYCRVVPYRIIPFVY